MANDDPLGSRKRSLLRHVQLQSNGKLLLAERGSRANSDNSGKFAADAARLTIRAATPLPRPLTAELYGRPISRIRILISNPCTICFDRFRIAHRFGYCTRISAPTCARINDASFRKRGYGRGRILPAKGFLNRPSLWVGNGSMMVFWFLVLGITGVIYGVSLLKVF